MNRAIFKYSLLMKLGQVRKFEMFLLVSAFLAFLSMAYTKQDMHTVCDALTSPVLLLCLGMRFAEDSALNQNSANDGEYFALLFTRPITRFSYVFTKAIVTAIGSLAMVVPFLLLLLLAQVLMGTKNITFIDAWQAGSLVMNAASFGCLLMVIRVLPQKIGIWLFLLCCSGAVGSWYTFGVRPNVEFNTVMTAGSELLQFTFSQWLYPAIDLETVFTRIPFSAAPIVSWLSNCLLYLLVATLIINKREFSYVQD